MRIGRIAAPFLSLLCICISLHGWSQPVFSHGRLVFRGKGEEKCLRQIRLYAENSEDDVILRHMSYDPNGLGPWVLFGDPGGEFDLISWDSALCLTGLRGQSRIRVARHEEGGWWITTPSDTFSLGAVKPMGEGALIQCELRQHFRLGSSAGGQVPLSSIPLLSFYADPKSPKWLEISRSETLDDVPPLVRITGALLAGIHLSLEE